MTSYEILEDLVNNDPDYSALVTEVNDLSRSQFPKDATALSMIHLGVPALKALPVPEFFATFKCMLAWAVVIKRILHKIHGDTKEDKQKAFPISKTKAALIYFEGRPSFYIDQTDSSAVLNIEVPLVIFEHSWPAPPVSNISFRLVTPVIRSTGVNEYGPDLHNSTMEVWIDLPISASKYTAQTKVKDFTPAWLSKVIDDSKLGD